MNDLSFLPSDHAQAEDRAYRYGQKNNVLVYYPIFENTIEGVIYDILNNKKQVIATVMGDNQHPADAAEEILETAKMLESAGAFSIVIEAVPSILADKISAAVKIPTIGIGASQNCDGQVLVIDDLLGLNQEFKPRFVTRYANLADEIKSAVKKFSSEVKEKKIPRQRKSALVDNLF